MSLWKVAWRSIRQRSLVSTLTVLSMGLGVALVVAVLVVYGVVDQSFHRGGEGYDLIVGAKGGKEQLVLNTVFYLSEPIGNIPYSFFEELSDGKYGHVEMAIPVCMGHTYQSFRVVATVPEIFDLKYRGDQTYRFAKGENFGPRNAVQELKFERASESPSGTFTLTVEDRTTAPIAYDSSISALKKNIQSALVKALNKGPRAKNDPAVIADVRDADTITLTFSGGACKKRPVDLVRVGSSLGGVKIKPANVVIGRKDNHFEAVMGATAAAKTNTQVGEPIKITHGSGLEAHVHDEGFEVVGILEPTGTPVDRAVFVNMLGFNELHHHDEAGEEEHAHHGKHGDEHAGEPKEITAVLVCIHKEDADRGMTDVMSKRINNTEVAQAVTPLRVITELFENVIGKLQWILLGMAVVTVMVAGIGIMVSIYNSMSDRRHEIAVMRALGASRFTVMLIILMESILLSLIGGAMGLLIGHGAIWLCSPIIADWTGVVIGLLQFQWSEFWLIFGLVLLASAVGYLPAMSAYRTDVAKSLITTP